MTIEEKLKSYILEQYGTIYAFTKSIGMPNSTFASIVKNGVERSSIQNISKICKALGISTEEFINGNIVPAEEPEKEDFDIIDFVKIFRYKLSDPDVAVLDDQHLTETEAKFLVNSLDLVIEQIRRMREDVQKGL